LTKEGEQPRLLVVGSELLETKAADTADPLAGLGAVVALRRLVDTLELRQVQAALAAGHSWSEIADALGVTRQAVHKKYHRRVDARGAHR
jgi:DNA-directed RNA polymerase specialized sigma24 family protein